MCIKAAKIPSGYTFASYFTQNALWDHQLYLIVVFHRKLDIEIIPLFSKPLIMSAGEATIPHHNPNVTIGEVKADW